jgi:hypothetical protein
MRWDGTQFVTDNPPSPIDTASHRAPRRSDRIRSGCAGAVLFFPFFLLLIILVLPIQSLLIAPVQAFVLSYPGAVLLYFAVVTVPLTVTFGQSVGQIMLGVHVVEAAPRGTLDVRRPGPLRAIVHVVLFVLLFPILWVPWLFGRSRLLHELGAGTEVLINPAPAKVTVSGRQWLTVLGAMYLVWTVLILVSGWGQAATYIAVTVMWAVPLTIALWVRTEEMLFKRNPHSILGMWLIAVPLAMACIGGPSFFFWAMLTGKMQLDATKTGKGVIVGLFLFGFGLWCLYSAIKVTVGGRHRSSPQHTKAGRQ